LILAEAEKLLSELQFVDGIMGLKYKYEEFCKEIMKRKCWILDWMERIEDMLIPLLLSVFTC